MSVEVTELELMIIGGFEEGLRSHDGFEDGVKGYLVRKYSSGDHYGVIASVLSSCNMILENEDGPRSSRSALDAFRDSVQRELSKGDLDSLVQILLLGASSLQLFVMNNWTGPPIPFEIFPLTSQDHESIMNELTVNDEVPHAKLKHPQLLWMSRVILHDCQEMLRSLPTVHWWNLRYLSVHQQLLSERSPTLYTSIMQEIHTVSMLEPFLTSDEYWRLEVQFHLEASWLCFYYYESLSGKDHLKKAQRKARLSADLTGALGKRTRFQKKEVSQLMLKVEINVDGQPARERPIPFEPDVPFTLPKDLLLDDEVRLHSIHFQDEDEACIPDLCSEDQAIILGLFIQEKRTNAIHRLVDEELLAYLTCILHQPLCWAIHSVALLHRSKLESDHSRTVERSMMQLQVLVDDYYKEVQESHRRLHLLYCSSLPPIWTVEKELADLLMKLGSTQSALDIYLRWELWEDVIRCYHLRQRRDRAEEIIRQQLAIQETPIMWCHLGDATDNPVYYLKAWELSNHRSARAQKSLGQFHFGKKQYKECIPFFEKSLGLNSLQLPVWFNLAYAAMQVEDWELAGKAYRRCCSLDPENFEAWNNLSNVYINLKQKTRAWQTLQEALKCNYENWRVWENYLLVSIDCGAFNEAIAAYHRVLDFQEKHVDVEVLKILVKAVSEGIGDIEGKSASEFRPKLEKLFGRITASVTSNSNVWRLYGDLKSSDSSLTVDGMYQVVQLLQKAQRCATLNQTWEKEYKPCQDLLELAIRLSEECLRYATESQKSSTYDQQTVSSVRMMIKSVVKRLMVQSELVESGPEVIRQLLNSLEEKLEAITLIGSAS